MTVDQLPIWTKCPYALPKGYVIRKGDQTTPNFENRYFVFLDKRYVEVTFMSGSMEHRISQAIRMLESIAH